MMIAVATLFGVGGYILGFSATNDVAVGVVGAVIAAAAPLVLERRNRG